MIAQSKRSLIGKKLNIEKNLWQTVWLVDIYVKRAASRGEATDSEVVFPAGGGL